MLHTLQEGINMDVSGEQKSPNVYCVHTRPIYGSVPYYIACYRKYIHRLFFFSFPAVSRTEFLCTGNLDNHQPLKRKDTVVA